MVVAEIFLTAFVQVLFEKLASGDLWNFARREQIHTLLKKWPRMLEQIGAVLADAEEKQMTHEWGIKLWLEDLEDLAYDLDDLLDEFNTEVLRRKVMEERQASTSKIRALVPTCCTSFSPSTLLYDRSMRSKIEDITGRLQDLFDRRAGLGLQNVVAGPSAIAPQRPPTSSFIREPCLYGRDGDERAIIELLLSDQSNTGNVGVVPIVGMGGVGKTTLAQMVYKHATVVNHFEKRAWVCVSDVFDIMGITNAILGSVTCQTYDFKTLDQVQVQLNKALHGKKFLIVLDDVWNKNHGDWSSLKSPFNDGARGSKVIVTTRNIRVASMMTGTNEYHSLKELSDDDCWSVFAQHAFENRSIDENPNLVSVGREIVKKCQGLPLAARTLGGLLRGKLRDDEWTEVLNSKIWELSDKESEILPALRLSYYHLPSHLEKCFAYCSVLPHDYEFEEKELVLWWMAEGLIQKPPGQKQMEDLGSEYFRELVLRSFFQPSSNGEVYLYVMHDLINDLAKFLARRTYFRLEDKLQDNDEDENIAKARYSSYMRGDHDGRKRFEVFFHAKNLRTFLPFGLRESWPTSFGLPDLWPISFLTSDVPLRLLPSLRRLRVLSLRRYVIRELSSSIGDLKHVRYLDLSNASILMLPESICTLYNLQTLILRDCINLKKLPTNTGNLINLRHLDITSTNSLQEMPPKIKKLTSLQTLSKFIVGKGDGSMINELGNLIHLKGTLRISGLENVADALDARRANLKDKKYLDVLLMEWSNISDDSRNGSVELKVLDMLKPHENLKELTLRGYHGLIFPTWVGNSLFSNIVSMVFQNCEKCTSLPPLGQLPSLAKLYIRGMKAIENVGLEFFGWHCSNPFPSLEILSFEDMPEWKDWSPLGVEQVTHAFACLSELSIKKCPKLLRKLPSNLLRLRKLDIKKCPLLVVAWVPSPTELNEVRNTLHFDSLTSLSLQDVSIPDSFRNSEVGDGAVLGNARFSHLSSLTSLRIDKIHGLTCLPSWFFQGLTGLQKLFLRDCEELTSLWKNEVRQQRCLPGLKCLVIRGCSQLISLFEEEEVDELQEHEEEVPYITMLEYLEINDCEKLEKLPQGLHNLKSLQELIVSYCPCLISFPKTGLPSTMRRLEIENCRALRSLPELMVLNSLEDLSISECPFLTYLSSPGNGLPTTLKQLYIAFCEKLEAILAEEGTEINCPVLESVTISFCDSLKSLPNVMQNNGVCLGNLTKLNIKECNNLESIPEGWFASNNLRDLSISKCKKLEVLRRHAYNNNSSNNLTSLQQLSLDSSAAGAELLSCILKEESSSFSSSSYFTNLTYLSLRNVDIGKPPSEWGLHRLSYLGDLELRSYGWASFPEDGMLWLPPSLIKLNVMHFENLERLCCKEFQNLPLLEELGIVDCEKLTSITELGQLLSLSRLIIMDCPNLLASFMEQGLPPALVYLKIYKCPKLKQGFEKGKGQYWDFISHIPEVEGLQYELKG